RTACSPFAPRAAAFRSWMVSFSAARSPAVSPVDALRAVLLTDFFVLFTLGDLLSAARRLREQEATHLACGSRRPRWRSPTQGEAAGAGGAGRAQARACW